MCSFGVKKVDLEASGLLGNEQDEMDKVNFSLSFSLSWVLT